MAIEAPEARRLSKLQWSVLGLWLAVGFGIMVLGAVMIADSGGRGPEHRGIHEGMRVFPWVFLAVALVWVLSLLPVGAIHTRITALRWCRIAIFVTAAAWVVWVALRPNLAG